MEKGAYNYWIRTSLGLEKIVLDELREKIKINNYLIKQRSLFIETGEHIKNEEEFFRGVRTADDVYKFINVFNGINKTKASIDKFIQYFRKSIIPIIQKHKHSVYFRVTVSFVGERNFSRFFVENELNKLVTDETHFKVLSNEKEEPREKGEFRLRCHIEETYAFLGVAVFDTPLHRRVWKIGTYDAQLHSPVAAAVARIARNLGVKDIIDPFCGSGTILIESAIINPHIHHSGFDLNKEALNLAKKRANLANVNIDLYNKSAFDSSINYRDNVIVSNPPWGDKHEIVNNDAEFVFKMREILLKSEGAVLIIPENMMGQFKKGGISLKEILRTRIRGKLAIIVMFHKN